MTRAAPAVVLLAGTLSLGGCISYLASDFRVVRPTHLTAQRLPAAPDETYLVAYQSSVDADGSVTVAFDVRSGPMCMTAREGARHHHRLAAGGDVLLGAALTFWGISQGTASECDVPEGEDAPKMCFVGAMTAVGGIIEGLWGAFLLLDPVGTPSLERVAEGPCSDGFTGVAEVALSTDGGRVDLHRRDIGQGVWGFGVKMPLSEFFSAKVLSSQGEFALGKFFPDLMASKEPPELEAALRVREPSGNGAFDAREAGALGVRVKNRGRGDGFVTFAFDAPPLAGLAVVVPTKVVRVPAGEEVDVDLAVTTTAELADARLTGKLGVTEVRLGTTLELPVDVKTRRERLPRVTFSGVVVEDGGKGDTVGNKDGRVDTNEQVVLVLTFQNEGEAPADDVMLKVTSTNTSIAVIKQFPAACPHLDVGAVYAIQVLVAVTKRYDEEGPLPLRFKLTAKRGVLVEGVVPLALGELPPVPTYKATPPPDPEIERRCPRE